MLGLLQLCMGGLGRFNSTNTSLGSSAAMDTHFPGWPTTPLLPIHSTHTATGKKSQTYHAAPDQRQAPLTAILKQARCEPRAKRLPTTPSTNVGFHIR